MTPANLHGRTTEAMTLNEAVQACQTVLQGALALLYTPARCHLAMIDGQGNALDNQGEVIDYGTVFEARLFNQAYELRWLNHYDGYGPAVLLTESDIPDSFNCLETPLPALPVMDVIQQTYVLWGEGIDDRPAEGWSTLVAARIGRLSIPIDGVGQGCGAHLVAREYLAAEPEFGNVSVVEERFVALMPFDLPKSASKSV